VPPEVREAWRLVQRSAGRCRVEDLAAHVGWSRRHLSEQFRLATGLPPKQAARIARFEATRRLLADPRRPPLAEVAARCGYADQPHLAREWRALAGCSVGTWLREELPFVQDSAPVVGGPSPA
jgi:AraC-like DNA-binding protein